MAAPVVLAAAAKAALVVATDKRAWTAVASVIAAVFIPFILVIVIILGLLDATSTHNVTAVELSFYGGELTEEVPEEYQKHIEDMRKSFSDLDGLIGSVENLEDGEIDKTMVKSFFYALFFGADQPSRRAQRAFLDCFFRYEERTRTVILEDDTEVEETYMAAIYITDQNTVIANLEDFLGQAVTEETRTNTNRIYELALYGRGGAGTLEAGDAMGDGTFQTLMDEAVKYIGYPYVMGGSSPKTSFDCSGYICWIFSKSGVYHLSRTTANGIYQQCAVVSREEARPGDLVFFTGTYASLGKVSHVGLYVGDGKMLHCGDPIGYADLNSSYWRSHFYNFGRLN